MEVTDYERLRLQNIKRNREMVAALNIHHSSRLHLNKRPRSQNKVKKESLSPTVRRESMRRRGLPPDDSTAAGLKTRKDYRLKPRKVTLRFADEPIPMSEAYRGEFKNCQLVNVINAMAEKGRMNCPSNGVHSVGLGGVGNSFSEKGITNGEFPSNGVESEDLGGLGKETRVLGSIDGMSEKGATNGECPSNGMESEDLGGLVEETRVFGSINGMSEKGRANGDCPSNGMESEDLGGLVEETRVLGSIDAMSEKGSYRDFPSNGMESEDLGGVVKETRVLGSIDLGKLKLEPHNTKRVVNGRIMSVKFFPTAERTLIVTGNTSGSVAFWDVDDEREDEPGNYMFHPHTAAVSGIFIDPFSLSKMFTSSYDGFIRLMDVERRMFDVVYSTNRPIYCISGQPNQLKSLYFGGDRGDCTMCDLRAPKSVTSWNLHGARINTIDFNSENSNLMATSSPDGTACIWDVRKINTDKPECIKFVKHDKPVHSAFFSPTGHYVATTSDNRIKVGVSDGPNFDDFLTIQHCNKVSQGMAFRGTWGWDDSYLYIGNMEGGLDVISMIEGKTVATFRNRYVSAMPWRFAAHPCQVGMLAGATGGGEVYIWTS